MSSAIYRAKCYACDEIAIGVRDLRLEGALIESACMRHADSTIRAFRACLYCCGPRPSRIVDGNFVHKSCEQDTSK